jgi:hypothetical protein
MYASCQAIICNYFVAYTRSAPANIIAPDAYGGLTAGFLPSTFDYYALSVVMAMLWLWCDNDMVVRLARWHNLQISKYDCEESGLDSVYAR